MLPHNPSPQTVEFPTIGHLPHNQTLMEHLCGCYTCQDADHLCETARFIVRYGLNDDPERPFDLP